MLTWVKLHVTGDVGREKWHAEAIVAHRGNTAIGYAGDRDSGTHSKHLACRVKRLRISVDIDQEGHVGSPQDGRHQRRQHGCVH